MNSETVLIVIVIFLCVEFLTGRILEGLNMRAMSSRLPHSLKGIYDEKEYARFQNYKKDSSRLEWISSIFSFILMITFLTLGGFGWYNHLVVGYISSPFWQLMCFLWSLTFVASLLGMPFNWYMTFRIEEKYGFNRTTGWTYIMDYFKELLITFIFGGIIIAIVFVFYLKFGNWFWLYAWGIISLFLVFIALFYSQLIVPLFNKQTPLEGGSLRDKIEAFAIKSAFHLENIYVIDGSKRTTKANAYFTGLGPKKRIVLYDTLIQELTEEEIVAVLAHEVGHYKKRHSVKMMIMSILQTGFMLWLFSLFVNQPYLSQALGGDKAYFQLAIIAFAILYGPVSTVIDILVNSWSRKHEYEADAYATLHYNGAALITGLKKISVKALSNLTPHPLYEFVYYSHPSLLKRINAILEKNQSTGNDRNN